MRILIISQYYFPEQFLINDIAPEFVRRGHNVTVVTGRPNYPTGKVYPGYEDNARAQEILNDVVIRRIPIIPRGHNKGQLLLNYFSYMFRANKAVKKLDGQFDVVFLYQLTPILQAYPAIKYAKRNHIHLLCYCLDLAPLSGNNVASFLKPLHFFYRHFSRWAYKSCDHIAVTSLDFIDYLRNIHKVPMNKISYIPQHAPMDLLDYDCRKIDSDGVPDFMFAGNIGEGARLDHIVYAAERLKQEGMRFRVHFVGNGSAKPMLEKIVKRLRMEDYVLFYGQVSITEMKSLYRKADALLVTLRKGQITAPGKIQAYMATGKPILGAMDGSGKKLIVESECGCCVDAEDVNGIAEMMSSYINHPEYYAGCGERGKLYFREHFLLGTCVDKILSLFEGGAKNHDKNEGINPLR